MSLSDIVINGFKAKGWNIYWHGNVPATDESIAEGVRLGPQSDLIEKTHYLVLPTFTPLNSPEALEFEMQLVESPPAYAMFRGEPIPGRAKFEGFYQIDSLVIDNGLNIVIGNFVGMPPTGNNIYIKPEDVERAIHFGINRCKKTQIGGEQ